MAHPIHSPRRGPRLPVRCTIRVALRSGAFLHASTVNVGPGGCAIETARRVEVGDRAFLELTDERVPGSRVFVGRIAWSSAEPPWRCGIAFDAGTARAAAALVSELVSAYPEVATDGDGASVGTLIERGMIEVVSPPER